MRENRRIKAALRMARLPVVKTLAGYDFSFQPSLDRNRILALAGLDFIERAEVVHLLGPPGTGKKATLRPRWRSRPCAPARRSTSSRLPI
ncbi:ATP-binding protein [Novosphingobium colocasiae]